MRTSTSGGPATWLCKGKDLYRTMQTCPWSADRSVRKPRACRVVGEGSVARAGKLLVCLLHGEIPLVIHLDGVEHQANGVGSLVGRVSLFEELDFVLHVVPTFGAEVEVYHAVVEHGEDGEGVAHLIALLFADRRDSLGGVIVLVEQVECTIDVAGLERLHALFADAQHTRSILGGQFGTELLGCGGLHLAAATYGETEHQAGEQHKQNGLSHVSHISLKESVHTRRTLSLGLFVQSIDYW